MPNRWAVGAIFAVVAGAIVGLALWLAPGRSQQPAGPGDGGQAPAAVVVDAPGTTTAGTPAAAGEAGPSVAPPAGAPAAVPPAPRRQQGAAVNAEDEPATTTTAAPVPTTTVAGPPPAPTETSRGELMPWCRTPEGSWYSGYGEGCTPDSPYFVEWR